MCVPLGREAGSGLIALSRRPDFPTDTEQTLLRVTANQAAIAIQRSKSEAQVAEQTRALEQLKATETALYTFTDRIFRAKLDHEIYEAGLDAITSILRCGRASNLLFDDHSVMRFVAWRAPSEQFRKVIDGHSPWKTDDLLAEPTCIGNCEEAADFTDKVKAEMSAERIAALTFFRSLQAANSSEHSWRTTMRLTSSLNEKSTRAPPLRGNSGLGSDAYFLKRRRGDWPQSWKRRMMRSLARMLMASFRLGTAVRRTCLATPPKRLLESR